MLSKELLSVGEGKHEGAQRSFLPRLERQFSLLINQ